MTPTGSWPDRLLDAVGLQPGESRTWTGPSCCKLAVPPGSYKAFVYADIGGDVEESAEGNRYERPEIILVPRPS